MARPCFRGRAVARRAKVARSAVSSPNEYPFFRLVPNPDGLLDENVPDFANRPELAERCALGVGVSALERFLARLDCFRSRIEWFANSARIRAGLACSGDGIFCNVRAHRIQLAWRG